ncbi:glycoside hydrolase family 48 protein [Aquimarina agarilytica]|uniref:glycoside hydrolase family 48 protein n=1 Tax=Aquimarina agarilytica TaxID=1087449 RepID=UPI000288C2A1|nr:glycoside hydrolase family 48 protein [Aquimarina agarilytica]
MILKKLSLYALAFFGTSGFAQSSFNYAEALQKSLFFYEVQQSGELPSWNRVTWRGDSALNDGSDVGVDLTGGWYDAGDHVKFNFPMAFSVTALSWGAIEYEEAYKNAGQLDIIKRNIKFVTDYLLKCHTGPTELYGQVGNGGLDHAYWGSSEVMVMDRPAYKISASAPGSDLAAETAAAMAAASILFKDSDPAYSKTLLDHAKQLYKFADDYRGVYSEAITDAAGFYRSFSGFQDELVWGAAWLYRATNDATYLAKAESEYDNLGNEGQSSNKAYKWGLAWDDKSYGSYVLMSQLTGKDKYKADAERHLDYWTDGFNGDRVPYSPGGQAHLTQWGSLRHSSNTSLLAFIYSDKVETSATNKKKYHDFAVRQINYALGDNPINRSFMVGFGNNPANNTHHRAAHGAWANSLQNRPDKPSHTLFGALAGGPSSPNDQFEDDRGDFIANEVACDYNACFTGALARMYSEFGGSTLANFPVKETPSRTEIRSYSKFNSNNAFGSTVKILLQNRSAWPARVMDKLSYRYYFDIAEGVAAGKTIDDYDIQLNGVGGSATMSIKSAGGTLYYAEISNIPSISPIGDPAFRNETQINFRVSNGVPYDTSNDPSASGLTGSSEIESVNIPVYDNGVLVFGQEPDGTTTPVDPVNTAPVASINADKFSGEAPLTVTFDASGSSDAENDALTYVWTFGNGETSTDENPSTIYTTAGSYLVSLVVNDGLLNSTEETITINVNDPAVNPVVVTGGTLSGGPFTFTVGDGVADNVSGVTVSGNTGATSQWVVTDETGKILGLPPAPEAVNFDEAPPGTCFIYNVSYNGTLNGLTVDANISGLSGDFQLSSNRVEVVRNAPIVVTPITVAGGTLNGGPFTFTVGDGIADNVSGVSVSGNSGATSQWVVTDEVGKILGLPPTPEAVNFDEAPAGSCFIYNVSFNGALNGLAVDSNISGLSGDFQLSSNSIEVVRNAVVVVTPPTGDCTFGAPIATPLETTYGYYTNMYAFGSSAPSMGNLSGFSFNWDLANNGLWSIAIQTTDGNPSYYVDLRDKTTHNLGASQPSITFAGTGIPGLDGTYYTARDGENLALVSTTADYTLYFSNSSTAPDCGDVIDTPIVVNGGTLTGGPFAFTVNDGIADNVSGVSVTGNTGSNFGWIVTDEDLNILGLPGTPEAVNFDEAGAGVCLIWHIAYEDGLTGLTAGENAGNLVGNFDLSNSIRVDRTAAIPSTVDGGTIVGGPFTFTVGDGIADNVSGVSVSGNTGSNFGWVVTDEDLNILGLPGTPEAVNFDEAPAGVCLIWHIAYEDGLTGLTVGENAGNLAGDFDLSNSIRVDRTGTNVPTPTVDGATVATSTGAVAVETITGDGIADLINFTTTSTATLNYSYLITDAAGNILVVEADSHDFEGVSVGVCLVYGISYEGTLSVTGKSITDTDLASGAFDVSDNSISVDRKDIPVVVDPTDPTTGGPDVNNKYIERFTEMRNEIYDPANGYFSKDGSPHHSVETLIVEAPDHGHESTSELYSYWLMMEAMQGRITKDWQPLAKVWSEMERMIIPTKADQPTNAAYDASSPAAYAAEFPLPSGYPAPLDFGAAVGQDPVSAELTAAYGPEVYQMHWLLDNDNFYGYGNRGDGTSTPSYINTFQRGEQESVYETIPHPSWESFEFGNSENGFLPLFILDTNYAKQWRYTSAPDADARAVQAMYWAVQYAKEQSGAIDPTLLDNTKKMGDYLRLAMFDKYFKKIGSQDEQGSAGTGYDSAHYLMSWYMSWGGSADPASAWAFRISSSHCHFGYQNPVAAYALTTLDELDLQTPNGERDWTTSLGRQMEFYRYLQSADGAIAGGATNSWNGDYSTYPAGKSTFYDMAYDDNPVYHDPGSGTWFGWQAWSVERVAEYYYITNDPLAKEIMDKWVAWVKPNVKLIGSDDFDIPATLEWSGEPDTWNAANPGDNANLRVTVTNFSKDLGIASSLAKTLTYYAAATRKHATLDEEAKNLAKEILDRMWVTYRDDKGVSAPESRGDYKRMFEEVVHVPTGYTGTMANGDEIKTGVTFLDIRSGLKDDPEYPAVKAAYDAGEDYTTRYHRTWAQMETALANAEYGFFFGEDDEAAGAKALDVELTVYPNPASELVTVTYPTEEDVALKVTLVDFAGRVITTQELLNEKSTTIDVSNLASGMYIVRLETKGNVIRTEKLIIK